MSAILMRENVRNVPPNVRKLSLNLTSYTLLTCSYKPRQKTLSDSLETPIFALEIETIIGNMKHIFPIIQIIALTLICHEIKAQGLVYEPFIPRQSSESYSPDYPKTGRNSSRVGVRASLERVRTSAYCLYNDGSVGKLRIEVEVSGGSAQVVGYYQAPQAMVYNSTGRWLQLQPQALVKKCYPDLSDNPLEQEVMYKANIRGIFITSICSIINCFNTPHVIVAK